MTSRVEFQDAKGGKAAGEIAEPRGDGRAPAVILFQEWWGLNDHIRSLAGRLAAEGFLTLAIDLYDGKTTKDAGEAAKLMQGLDWGQAIARAKGAFAYLEEHPRSNGKVGAIGFCMGGALTFATAAAIPELGAAVPFYGIPDPKNVDFGAIRAPVLAHFAKRDEWAKPAAAEAVRDRLAAAGRSMQVEVYDADHAFVNDTRPEVYDEASAKLAWSRTIEFLKKHLSG